MKSILIIGMGRFGRHTAMKLIEMGHEVMAIDICEERVDNVLPFVTNAQIGDGTNKAFLSELGVRDFDVCVVAIGDDFQASLVTTAHLKDLGAEPVVSRASSGTHEKFLLRNGADEVIYPEKQLATWAAIRYSSEKIFDYMELDEGYGIYEVAVPEAWVGRTIGDLNIRQKFKFNILGLKREGKLDMEITANSVIYEEHRMLVLGKHKDLHKSFKI